MAVRFVTAKRGPERASETRQYDLSRPRVGQREPPRFGSTICCGQELARKSHQDSAVRFVTAKNWSERATKSHRTICYGQDLARKSHQDSAVRFVAAKRGPERATKTRICCGQELARKSHRDSAVLFVTAKSLARKSHQDSAVRFIMAKRVPGQELARKSHQDSAVRFVAAKSWPERATKTRQYDLLRPRVGQKEPPRLGSTICYGQTWARKSHQDSAVRFVTAKSCPERATKIRQYDLLRPRVGQKKPPRLGSTIFYGQTWARKSHQDSAVRFVTAKSWPERGTWARKSHQDSAVRFVTAKSWPEKATETRKYDLLRPRVGQTKQEYDLLRPRVGQKESPRLGSTICYGQELAKQSRSTICYGQTWARKSHQESAVRFVTAKRGPERATKTRQYDLLRPRVGPTKTLQTWARKSHQDSAVRFVTSKSWPEKATKTRQYDLSQPRVGQKKPPRLSSTICYGQQQEPPRLGSTICYGQELARRSHQDSAVRFVTNVRQKEPPRLGSTICCGQAWARKSHRDSAVRFVTAKCGPKPATKTRQYDLLRRRVGQKEPPRLGSTICYGQELARKSHRDSAVQFVMAKRGPERATKIRQYDLLRPRVVQKEPPRFGSTICYGQELARKSHQDSAVRFVTAKSWPEGAIKTRQYDLLRARVVQKEPPRLGSTICYGQELARKSHQDSAVRVDTAKSWPERATKSRQYDLLRPRVGQKEPPRLGSTICYGQTWTRKSHQDSAVRFVTAKSWPERATKTRQYDLLRPNVGQKEPPRLDSTICYGQELARKSHQDSAVTAKNCPERATKTRQYDLLRPRVGLKESPRLGSYGQELSRKSHQDSAVRWPEKASKTRQYYLLRPRVGQKKLPRLGSTICYGQRWARKSHQDSAVRFVTAKSWPERATKTRQYDLLRPNVGQKEPPSLDSTICYGQELTGKSLLRPNVGQKEPSRLLWPRLGHKKPSILGSTICYGQTWARKS